VRDKHFLSAQSNFINEKYFDKYKNKKMYAKIRVTVALGVCFSIE